MFCAARIGAPPSTLRSRPWAATRHFRSSARLPKPLGAAAAEQQDDNEPPAQQSQPKPSFGGWSKPTFGAPQGLTPEEEKQRQTILAQQAKANSETKPSNAQSQSSNTNRFSMNRPTKPYDGRQTVPNKNSTNTVGATAQEDKPGTKNKRSNQSANTNRFTIYRFATKDSPGRPIDLGENGGNNIRATGREPVRKIRPNWTCPRCSFPCHGHRQTCPKCDSPPGPVKATSPSSISARASPNEDNSSKRGSSVDQRERDFKNFTPKGAVPFRKMDTANLPDPDFGANFPGYSSPKRGEAVDYRKEDAMSTSAKQDFNDRHLETADPLPTPSKRYARLAEAFQPEEEVQPKKSNKQFAKRQSRKTSNRSGPDQYYDDEFDDYAPRSKRRDKNRNDSKPAGPTPLYLPEFISVRNLAEVLAVEIQTFVDLLEDMGFEGTKNTDILDAETAGLIATEFNFEPVFSQAEEDIIAAPPPEDKSILPSRPPVVTIMGHVDHGKTTILDWLRKSSVAASEHGGITQHIGAFSVPMPSGKLITFLDTPGHAAFLDMRRRGADVTDMVILVVAADDSVKPQTIEAIKHAKQAKVPVIVAINKVDKDDADPERVKQDLARNSVDVEDYGGDVQAVCVSGKTGQGMLELEEAAVTLSELLDHRAEIDGNVEGFVIEATAKKGGRVATVLVKRGTLRPGDIVVAGPTWARIRTLRNEAGVLIDEAKPGTPVQVDGWREQPAAGSEVLQAPTEQRAKGAVAVRQEKIETKKLSQDMEAINETRRAESERRQKEIEANKQANRHANKQADISVAEDDSTLESSKSGPKGVPFFVKADVSGSAEALVNSIAALGNNEVFPNVLRSGVGPVSEFDVQHAAIAKGHIISFNQPIEPAIFRTAEMDGVRIMDHNIIYEVIDDVKDKLSEHLPPIVTHRVTGEAEISEIFNISTKGRNTVAIAGCKVRNGTIHRSHKTRVMRGTETIYDGKLFSPSVSVVKNL